MRVLVQVLLAATFVKMLIYQLYVKATKLSRASRTLRDASERLPKTGTFMLSMWQYNTEVIRRSRRCVDQLTAARIREVSLFGVGHVAEVLYYLTFGTPLNIVAVYDDVTLDDMPPERFFRYLVQPAAVCRAREHKVIVAALVGIEDQLQKLRDSGIRGDQIIVIP